MGKYLKQEDNMMDISHLTLEELAFLRSQIDALLKIRYVERVVTARRQILSIASKVGVPVEAILDERGIKEKPISRPIQHPDRPDLTWAGRGRRPKWIKEFLDMGKSIDDLRPDLPTDVEHPA